MAAPSNTVWGSTINSKTRIGISISTSSTNTQVTVTAKVYFWSKYSVHEQEKNNSFYFDWDKSSASTAKGGVYIYTTSDSGTGWSTTNQQLIATYSKTYNKGTSASTKYVSAALSGINVSSGTMRVNTTVSIPALTSYKVTYNANGGSGAPSAQTKYYGTNLKLSSTKPTRTGYTFKGWGASADAEAASYQPGGNYTSNKSITLYAVWEVGVLVEFEITEQVSVTIPDNLGSGLANVPSVTVPISVIYESANSGMNVYYRICYADTPEGSVGNYQSNSLDIIYGPSKPANIGSSIEISSELLKKAIQSQKDPTSATFVIQVCTGANTFESILTSKTTFTVDILDFSIISGELYGAWWEDSTTMKIIVEYKLPKSYTLTSSTLIKPSFTNYDNTINITSAQTTITEDEEYKTIRYIFTVSNPVEDFSKIELTDGLTIGELFVRIVPHDKDQSIIINKSDKSIEAIEFIEHSKLYGFQKGGRVYFPDFTEITENDIGAEVLNLMMYDMIERE